MSNFSLQVGDGTIVNGNPRGNNSIDLQLFRTAATQVASGVGSMIVGGGANSATGLYSAVMGGYSNISSGIYGVTGGSGNTASGQASVAIGAGNIASALGSACLGSENQVTAAASIAIGSGNVVSAINAAIINSVTSVTLSTAPYSIILGGNAAIAYMPGQLVTNARITYGAGNFQVTEVLVFSESVQPSGTAQSILLTLDGLPASIINQLNMNGSNKVWQIVSDWMLIDVTNNLVSSGKDIIVADKRAGTVRALYKTKIAETGDAAMITNWESNYVRNYSAGVDVQVLMVPVAVSLVATTTFRAVAKLTITEIKSN